MRKKRFVAECPLEKSISGYSNSLLLWAKKAGKGKLHCPRIEREKNAIEIHNRILADIKLQNQEKLEELQTSNWIQKICKKNRWDSRKNLKKCLVRNKKPLVYS